jgi:hypothetical protein
MPLVDLDDPEELRARWTALAAVAHATGFDRRWYADGDGYHHQDETASVLRMSRLGDGRAVLWGFHTQHSQTAGSDLLAGSPDWIGQPEVRVRQDAGELGFVYGAFNGTWARASYPGDPWEPVGDGFAEIGSWITSDEAAADEMVEWVAEWADYLGGLDELRPAGVALIRTVATSGISAEALAGFFDHFGIDPRSPVQPDLPSGVAAGEDFTAENLAVPATLPDDPDTAEVSVVTDPVTDATGDHSTVDDEESFVVPPGISPFTGQPIADEPPPVAGAPAPAGRGAGAYEPTPVASGPAPASRGARDEDYGVTAKKQGWLRRRKDQGDEGPAPAPAAPGSYLPPNDGPASDPAVPGSYLPPNEGLATHQQPYGRAPQPAPEGPPYRVQPSAYARGQQSAHDRAQQSANDRAQQSGATRGPGYDPRLPSAEPPRVGGGVYEGDDFYNSLFADAPAPTTPVEEQDWETAEQPSWSAEKATSEYNPFTDTSANNPSWTGPGWVNGQWVEDPSALTDDTPTGEPLAPVTDEPPAEDDDAPTAEIAAVLDPPPEEEPQSFTGPSPFAPQSQAPTPNDQQHNQAHTDQSREEQTRAEQAAPEHARAEARAEQAAPEHARAEHAGAEHGRAEQLRVEQLRVEQEQEQEARAEEARREQADQLRAEQQRQELERAAQAREEQERAAQAREEQERADQAREEQMRAERARAEQPRLEQAHAEQARQEQVRAEELRAEQVHAEQASAEKAREAAEVADPADDDQTAEIPAVVDDLGQSAPTEDNATTAYGPEPTTAADDLDDEVEGRERAALRFNVIGADYDEDEIYSERPAAQTTSAPADPIPSTTPAHPTAQSIPTPSPIPGPPPVPGPTPGPYPGPTPGPHPGPFPEPDPFPRPEPIPQPGPSPRPEPSPQPGPEPIPGPGPIPTPEPIPGPGPIPAPEPIPGPIPAPEPIPGPEPGREPSPVPDPEPGPLPGPGPRPVPDPEPEPGPEPEPHPGPEPDPEPGPHPGPEPDPERIPPPEPSPYLKPEPDTGTVPDQPERAPEYARYTETKADPRAEPESETGPVPDQPQRAPEYAQYEEPEYAQYTETEADPRLETGADAASDRPERGSEDARYAAGDPEDEAPTGSFPVLVGDDEPTGVMAAVRFEDEVDAGRMSIPGLGLVEADEPRVMADAGSVEEAMRAEIERPRPRPGESEAMRALHAWCRARTAIVPSGFTIQVQVLDPEAPSYRFDLEPPDVDDPELHADKLSGLLGDLWLTESQGDLGGWLFARIDAAGRTLRIDRWYDQVPDWWDNPIEPRLDVMSLVRRLYDRGPQYQPSYLEKLYTSAT